MTIRASGTRWRKRTVSWVALLAGVAAASALHYVTPPEHFVLHAIYHRSYYVPVILAAYWYGPLGGIAIALVSAVAYIPHIQTAWFLNRPYTVNQYAETVVFVLLGVAVGLIAAHQRRLTNRYREAAESLERVNRDLRESGERLRRAERLSAVGEIAAGLAHEIRNPLAGVKGAVEIVSSRAHPGTPEAEFCGIAARELSRLEALVREFLDFARPSPPRLQPVDPGSVVERAVALLRSQAERAGVELAVTPAHGPGAAAAVSIDPAQIEQVLVNVLLNAVDASTRGGRVVVEHGAAGERYRIAVSDRGPGIPPEIRRRLFEPFFTTKERGTGLGLAISQRIVNAHAGEIRIICGETTPGGPEAPPARPDPGTTVEILLPCAAASV